MKKRVASKKASGKKIISRRTLGMKQRMSGSYVPANAPATENRTIEFVFRFRPQLADALGEHRLIIKQHKLCWWGWWKRPTENDRADIWDALNAETCTGQRVPVGLYNTEDGKVYRAWVIKVIPPSKVHNGRSGKRGLSHQQEKLVPLYYRESPFSHAWICLDEIEGEIAFFGRYSFSEVPAVPNYPKDILERLKDKVILSPAELRGMDVTIWRVRPRKDGDSSDPLVLTIQSLPASVSAEAVRCPSNFILHITDLHFATGPHREQHIWRLEGTGETRTTMTEAITQSLGDKRKVGLVIITGDLTFTGAPEEFEQARISLRRLLGILDLSTDHLIVIPGNHDIRWSTEATYSDKQPVTEAPEAAKENYKAFYKALFKHLPDRHLSMGRRYLLPCGMAVEICALNSSSLETGKNFLAGMGYTDEASFRDVERILEWKTRETMALRILALHHHLTITEDVEPTEGYPHGFGLAIDAIRLQRVAARAGVQLALHGHKHRASVWRSSVFELPEFSHPTHRLGELSILGGGSAGSTDTESQANYFNLIEVVPSALTLEIYRAKMAQSFKLMQTWRAGFKLADSPSRLVLEDWSLCK